MLCFFGESPSVTSQNNRGDCKSPSSNISCNSPLLCSSSHVSSLHSIPLSFITSPYVDSCTLLFLCLILLTQHWPNEVRYTAGLIGGYGQSLLAKTINRMDHTLSPGGCLNCRVLRRRRLFLELNHVENNKQQINPTFSCPESLSHSVKANTTQHCKLDPKCGPLTTVQRLSL